MALKKIQYSTVQFANLVGVCATTARRWDNDKILVAHRLSNGKRYYDDKDVEIAKARVGATAPALLPIITRYTIGEFAKMIGVTVLTAQNWDNKGTLKAYRTITNRRYYTEDHVSKVIEGRKV